MSSVFNFVAGMIGKKLLGNQAGGMPGEKVAWEGFRLGIHAVHEFYFAEKNGGVELTSIENFSGPLLIVARMIRIPSRLHALTIQPLEAIRQAAESSGAEAHPF